MTEDTLEVVAFGCAWSVDISSLPLHERVELQRRWERCHPSVLRPSGHPGPGEDPATGRARVWRRGDADDAPVAASHHADLLPEPLDLVVRVDDDPDLVSYDISRALTRGSIARQTGFALLVHAAGLADPDTGRALMLAAPSGTGKSTASSHLARRFGYLSDETVALTEDLVVLPWPKPPSLKRSELHHDKEEPSPDDIGLQPAVVGAHLHATVLLAREEDATVPRLERLGVIEAMSALIPQTSALPWLPRPLARLAEAVSAGVGMHRLHYAEIEDCASLLDELLQREPEPDTGEGRTWWHLPPAPGAWPGWENDTPSPRSVRVPGEPVVRSLYRDAVTDGASVLLLAGSTPVRLDGLGALLWEIAEEPLTVDELFAEAVDTLGHLPGARAVFDSTVDLLWSNGALRHRPVRFPLPVALQPMRGTHS